MGISALLRQAVIAALGRADFFLFFQFLYGFAYFVFFQTGGFGDFTGAHRFAGIGQSLGRGTILSMLLVLFVLPQILLIGGGIVDKTSFAVPKVIHKRETSGRMFVVGVVTGEINGTISGIMRASVDGDINLNLLSGNISEQSLPEHIPSTESVKPKPTEAETGKEVDTDEKE